VQWGRRVSPPGPHTHSGHGLKETAAVEGDQPVVAEVDECVLEHSWESQVVLVRGTKTPVLIEGIVGVVVQAHLKQTAINTLLTPK
jgi:hypothetical protein